MHNATIRHRSQPSALLHKDTPPIQPLLYTRPEAAARLAISLRTLDDQMAAGRLKFCRIGRSIRFRPEGLDDFIAENETQLLPKAAGGGKRNGTLAQ